MQLKNMGEQFKVYARPLTSSNKHSESELELISTMYALYGLYGNAEIYVRLL